MLEKIIKAYDIRGLVKDEITPDFSFSLGVAYAKFLELEREPATIVRKDARTALERPMAGWKCSSCDLCCVSRALDAARKMFTMLRIESAAAQLLSAPTIERNDC